MDDGVFWSVRALALDYLDDVLQTPRLGTVPSRTSRALQNVMFSVQGDVEKALKPCFDSLDVGSVGAARRIFGQIVEKEFEDGIVNWGRIVTIFVLGGILTKKLQRSGVPLTRETREEISCFIAEFTTHHAGEWIRQNGGWENGFLNKFEQKTVWSVLADISMKILGVLSHLKQFY
ncbi:bcl-2-related protein A1 [Ornithorhynchus anatinus]|uniref:Bcl-2-related protein A1 n=1 Tax=Ornithorhynchus anatinus TaxID=9258 RepID=F6S8G3_ORNAN|nr:bcl-2-related protein A1 [Ornithorhynchus anatinus]